LLKVAQQCKDRTRTGYHASPVFLPQLICRQKARGLVLPYRKNERKERKKRKKGRKEGRKEERKKKKKERKEERKEERKRGRKKYSYWHFCCFVGQNIESEMFV